MKKVPLKWADFGKNGAVFRNGGVGRPVGRNSEPAGRFRRKTSGHTADHIGQFVLIMRLRLMIHTDELN